MILARPLGCHDPLCNFQSEKEHAKVLGSAGWESDEINMYLLAFISLDISSALARGFSSSFHFVKVTERHLALRWLLY